MSRRLSLTLAIVLAACVSASDSGTTPSPGTSSSASGSTAPGSTGSTGTAGQGDGLTCWSASPGGGSDDISFSDQTAAMGLIDPLLGMHGHAAVWGDFDGDLVPDLYAGTFADREPEEYQVRGAVGPSPDRLLMSGSGGFAQAEGLPEMFTRTSGGAVADLDLDGDLDLVVSRNFDEDTADAPSSQILRNDEGMLVPLVDSGLPSQFGGRSVGVLDYDGDGLIDLFIAEDRYSDEASSVLLRNLGELRFEDATTGAGFPTGVHGLGVGVADLTGDGHQDVFVAGSNRLFIANGDATFHEADSAVFTWDYFGEEDDVSGVSIADVNRDGMLDLSIGHHFNSTIDDGISVPVRLYLNRGTNGGGDPDFEDVTESAGLVGLPTKGPHVEINDFDNDGWPDLMTTASAGDGTAPAIFRNEGMDGGTPRFATPQGLGSPQYWIAGPSADFDRDGRLDVFLVEWEPTIPSLLLRNETASGHWLEVSIGPERGFGIGWRIEVYPTGSVEEASALLGAREISVTQGYSAGVAPIAHFGLGEQTQVDLLLKPPGGGEATIAAGVAADQHIRLPSGCP